MITEVIACHFAARNIRRLCGQQSSVQIDVIFHPSSKGAFSGLYSETTGPRAPSLRTASPLLFLVSVELMRPIYWPALAK